MYVRKLNLNPKKNPIHHLGIPTKPAIQMFSRLATCVAGGLHAHPLFTVQAGLSVAGLVLCSFLLGLRGQPEVYMPVMASIIAYWMPHPEAPPPARQAESVASNGPIAS